MAINFCSFIKQDLSVPHRLICTIAYKKFFRMNMVTCIVKGNSKIEP